MSTWTDIRDRWEQFQTAGLYNPKESRQKEAEARYIVNDQIKAYKDQTAIARKEIEAKRGEQIAEKRRIEEKQIRSLRRNYRSPGMLGTSSTTEGMSQKLGG